MIRQAPVTRHRHYCECDSCRAWFPARAGGLPYFEPACLRADALEAGWRFRAIDSDSCLCPACLLAWTGHATSHSVRNGMASTAHTPARPAAAAARGTARRVHTA